MCLESQQRPLQGGSMRKGPMDNSPPTDTQPLVLPLHSQSVPGAAVRSSQPLEDRLSYFLLLDEISSCLRHYCQCLRDLVGGHALCPEIQDHAFFIVPPKDAINKITPTRPQDMDRVHGALLPSAQGSIILPRFA